MTRESLRSIVVLLFYLMIGTSGEDGTRSTISIFDTLPGHDWNGAAWATISIGVGLFGRHAWEAAAAATWYANDDQRLPKHTQSRRSVHEPCTTLYVLIRVEFARRRLAHGSGGWLF